jgi:hypothetical protein
MHKSQFNIIFSRTGVVAEAVECLLSKGETLSSNPDTTKNEN